MRFITATLALLVLLLPSPANTQTIRGTIESNYSGATGGGVAAEGPVEMTGTDVVSNSVDATELLDGGGGIWSAGTLVVRSCRLDSNSANGVTSDDIARGAGIFYGGPDLLIEDSAISNNEVNTHPNGFGFAKGGGLYLLEGTGGAGAATVRRTAISSNTAWIAAGLYAGNDTLVLEDCTISDNIATSSAGGGMGFETKSTSVFRILHSTISGNEADVTGGGFYTNGHGRVQISNSTISGNAAGESGGGIYTSMVYIEIASSTITDNTADADADGLGDGGGIYILSNRSIGLKNTIVASNHDLSPPPSLSATECHGTVDSAGYNLIESVGFLPKSCIVAGDTTGVIVGVDPLLAVLADNGGPTATHALSPGSVAIDAGDPGGCRNPEGAPLDSDQRYGLRQDRCDIGAFEWGAVVELVFENGFESASTSAWSSSVP